MPRVRKPRTDAQKELARAAQHRFKERHPRRQNEKALAYYYAHKAEILAKQSAQRQGEGREAYLAYLRQYRSGNSTRVEPIPELWPYGCDDRLCLRINEIVPRGIPEDVRADVCQELVLAVLAGDVELENASKSLPQATRVAFGQAFMWRLDWTMADGLTVADHLSYDQYV